MPLKAPPRDSDGRVIPHDHEEILAADRIIRRISIEYAQADANGRKYISTKAFRPSAEDGMSIDIEKAIVEIGSLPSVHVTSPKWVGSVVLSAESIRRLDLKIGYDPTVEDLDQGISANVAHGQAWKLSNGQAKPFSRTQQLGLLAASTWLVPIDNCDLHRDGM